jgi:hypothetical protein
MSFDSSVDRVACPQAGRTFPVRVAIFIFSLAFRNVPGYTNDPQNVLEKCSVYIIKLC